MVGRPPRQKAKNDARQQLCFSCIKSADNVADLFTRHGAERYTGYLEFMFYGYHLDRAIPRIPEAVYCSTPSLLVTKALFKPAFESLRNLPLQEWELDHKYVDVEQDAGSKS